MFFVANAPLAAQEPPGAWFLNAQGTGDDAVYFSVGGSADAPPRESREVLLGWSWDEAGTATRRYPGSVPARYRSSRLSGKQPRQWIDESHRAGVPALGVGPGRELILLGDDERSTALAMRWAEMLDSVEAAYRHSSPDLAANRRHGVIEVGRIGRCAIRSVPVDGDQDGWSTLNLAGHARPSRDGGYYYVDPPAGSPRRQMEGTVGVQRFLRLLDGPADCGGHGLDLSMIPAPREEEFYPPYFLVLSDVAVQPLDFLDLEPTPRTPAVRTRARRPGTAREEINIAHWPRASARGIDLCQAPFMATLCLKDQRIREQLATAATSDPQVAGPLVAGCREFFARLGTAPSPHPCSDPGVWRQSIGPYLTGYLGEMLLREQPRLSSRTNAAGEVQWLWSDTRAPRPASGLPAPPPIRLADGTRVAIGVPRTAPPEFRPPIPAPSPSDLPINPSGSMPPPSTPAITPVMTPVIESVPPPDTASDPEFTPGPATDPVPPLQALTDPDPPPDTTADPLPPPETTRDPPGTATDPVRPAPDTTADPPPETTGPPSETTDLPSETTTGSSPPDTSTGTNNDAATDPQPNTTAEPVTSPDSASPSGISASPVAALSRSWLVPLALLALAMITGVALVLRGQRTSVRSRRQALSSGLVADEPAPEMLLEEDTQGERLLAGRDSPGAPTGELLLEPIDDVEVAVEPPAVVLPLEPPELSEAPIVDPPAASDTESRWPELTTEWEAFEDRDRQKISESLAAISRLGEWLGCLLPVLDDVEHGRGDLPALDHLPTPAQQEWRDSHQTIRDFADVDLVALDQLRLELTDSSSFSASYEGDAEAQYLAQAGLLDPELGTLPERLRRHLLRPDRGRLHQLVLCLQYLIEAFPVEHLEKSERKAYLGAIRGRLRQRGLSTRFHQLVDELSSGLGLRYLQARFYKARIDDPGNALFGDRHDTVDLSRRLGYPAGTDDRVVVRLSELFLLEAASGTPYSGQALIDGG